MQRQSWIQKLHEQLPKEEAIIMHEIRLITAQRAVTAAGTPEKIKEALESLQNKVISITIRAHTGNAGFIYVAYEQSAASAAFGYVLSAGEVLPLDVHDIYDGYLDLSKIWIDASVNGDGISYIAFEVI